MQRLTVTVFPRTNLWASCFETLSTNIYCVIGIAISETSVTVIKGSARADICVMLDR